VRVGEWVVGKVRTGGKKSCRGIGVGLRISRAFTWEENGLKETGYSMSEITKGGNINPMQERSRTKENAISEKGTKGNGPEDCQNQCKGERGKESTSKNTWARNDLKRMKCNRGRPNHKKSADKGTEGRGKFWRGMKVEKKKE